MQDIIFVGYASDFTEGLLKAVRECAIANNFIVAYDVSIPEIKLLGGRFDVTKSDLVAEFPSNRIEKRDARYGKRGAWRGKRNEYGKLR